MIRPFQTDDTDTIVSIWRDASALAHSFLPAAFIEQEADALRNIYLVHAETSVIEVDGTIVGFVSLVDDELAGLFLRPAFHGRGLGRAMVDFAKAQKGPLRVEVFENNHIGRKFYASYGFRGDETFVHEASGEVVLKLVLPVV